MPIKKYFEKVKEKNRGELDPLADWAQYLRAFGLLVLRRKRRYLSGPTGPRISAVHAVTTRHHWTHWDPGSRPYTQDPQDQDAGPGRRTSS